MSQREYLKSCLRVVCPLFICLVSTILLAQEKYDTRAHYEKAEYMVAMRDGVKLYTQVYTPKDITQKYPIILFRTPYSVRYYEPKHFRRIFFNELYTREGFIFVYQDVRGKFESEGEFIVMKPHKTVKSGPQDVDESSDTYDTIEWALENIPNHNGRVGQWGISYPGFQTVMGMIDAHPALKASSPQASPNQGTRYTKIECPITASGSRSLSQSKVCGSSRYTPCKWVALTAKTPARSWKPGSMGHLSLDNIPKLGRQV